MQIATAEGAVRLRLGQALRALPDPRRRPGHRRQQPRGRRHAARLPCRRARRWRHHFRHELRSCCRDWSTCSRWGRRRQLPVRVTQNVTPATESRWRTACIRQCARSRAPGASALEFLMRHRLRRDGELAARTRRARRPRAGARPRRRAARARPASRPARPRSTSATRGTPALTRQVDAARAVGDRQAGVADHQHVAMAQAGDDVRTVRRAAAVVRFTGRSSRAAGGSAARRAVRDGGLRAAARHAQSRRRGCRARRLRPATRPRPAPRRARR